MLAVTSFLVSCGSGVIGGIFAGSQGRSSNGNTGDARPPQILLDRQSIPIVGDWLPPGTTLLTLRIPNYILPAQSTASISLSAPSIDLTRDLTRSEVGFASVDVATATTTLRSFVDVNLVRALLKVPDRSVDTLVHAEVDGIDIATPATLRFVEPGEVSGKSGNLLAGAIVVSVEGTSRIRLTANKLLAPTSDAADVELSVLQRNYQSPRLVNGQPNLDAQRRVFAPNKAYSRDSSTGISQVEGVAPAARFPGIARVLLRDPISGVALDTVNGNKIIDLPRLLYVPSLLAVGPASIALEGGVQSRLLGRGLVPAENEGEFEYLWDRISLSIEKGNSRTQVRPEAIFRDESTEQGIAFRMPESPDGLPGTGSLILEQSLGDTGEISYQSRLESGLRFARSNPELGPYVSDLVTPSSDFAAGRFRPESPFGDDVVVLSEDGNGTGRVTLLKNQGSGLFRSVGASISTLIENPLALEGDAFDGSDPLDLFVVGGVASAGKTRHSLMLGQSGSGSILEPFRHVDQQPVGFATDGDVADSATGDFDGDGTVDLVILRKGIAQRPIELWTAVGGRLPLRQDFGESGRGARSRLHVADFDFDGSLDLAFDEQSTVREVVVLFGTGNASFGPPQRVRWDANPALTSATPTVLTSVRAKIGVTTRRHLVIGAEVQRSSTATVAWLGVMQQTATGFKAVSTASEANVDSSARFDHFVVLDLDKDGADELVCVSNDSVAGAPLHAFAFASGAPALLTNGATDGERLTNVTAMKTSRLEIGGRTREALLVQHDDEYNASRVSSLSTFLVGNDKLVSRRPRLPTAAEPQDAVIGDFDGDGIRDDVSWFDERGISAVHYAAPGIFEENAGFDLPLVTTTILQKTLVALPDSRGASLAWLERDGRIAVLDTRTKKIQRSTDLRRYFGASSGNLELDEQSKLLVVDPDNDGVRDLVVFLRSKSSSANNLVRLAFCRGKSATSNEFVFHEPNSALSLDGTALAPHAGNMLGHDPVRRPGLEVTYDTGASVQFATIDLRVKPEEDLFVTLPSLTLKTLTISQAPTLVDLDEDGRDDLVVLAPDVRGLRVWFNRLTWTGSGFVGELVSLGGSLLSFPGDPLGLEVVDMNGDGLRDLLVVSQIRDGQDLRPLLTLFRNQDRGSLAFAYVMSNRWTGSRMPTAWASADLDGNGMTDLVFGNQILLCR